MRPTCNNDRGREMRAPVQGNGLNGRSFFLFLFSFFYFSCFRIYRHSRHLYICIYLSILDKPKII
jgi:hypothetical protein